MYNYGCRMGWPNTVYRDLKAAVATTRPAAHSTISAGSQALPSPTRSRSGLVLETSASQDSTESTIPDDNSGGSKSKAWIAGAVVGPIAGLVLLGGGILFWFRRRRNKTVKIAPVYELDESQQRPFEKYSHFGKPVGSYNTSTLAELPPETRPVELPAGR